MKKKSKNLEVRREEGIENLEGRRSEKTEPDSSFSIQNSKFKIPRLRFPEFRGAEGWGERPLSEFMSESRLPGSKGNVAKKITVKLWGNGVFEKNEAIQGSINTQYFRRNAGQFIYSKLDFLNQAFGIIPPSLDGFESTVDLPCFDFADGLIPAFLLEYVKRRDFYERLGETADGSRKARRIHAETFLSFPIALPSPAEQQKIAECLSSVDELMAAQGRKVDALKTHKRGLMQQLFPRRNENSEVRSEKTEPNSSFSIQNSNFSIPSLRFPEFQNAGEWESKLLGDVVKSFKTGKLDANAMVENGQYRFYTCAKNHYQIDDYAFEGEALLVAGNGAHLGYIHHYIGKFNAYQRTYVLQDFNANVVFLRCLLDRYLPARIQFEKKDGNTPYIVLSTLTEMPLVIPRDLAEQQRIATCLSSLDALITAETQKHEALKTHKKGLMQQLFPSPEEIEV